MIGKLKTSKFSDLLSKRDASIVKDQWRLYQLECVDEGWVEIQTVKLHLTDYYWSKILQITSSSGDRKYTHLSKVVKSYLFIPNENANVERSLSDNKNVLTSERTNIKEETLMVLRRAKTFTINCGGAQKVNTQIKC